MNHWRNRGLSMLAAVILTAAPVAAADPAPNGKSWSENAVSDLREVRALIEANTPGPVDPLNPGYRRWLNDGYEEAIRAAGNANGVNDYLNALRLYTNGFRDAHLGVRTTLTKFDFQWPLFLTVMDDDGKQRVRVADAGSPVPVGAELVECDGKSADALLHERVNRYRQNADLPHLKGANAIRLFYATRDAAMPQRCRFRVHGADRRVSLRYQALGEDRLTEAWNQARPAVKVAMGVHEHPGVWMISVPTFIGDGQNFEQLYSAVEAKLPQLREAPTVVIDVRGNGGGNSGFATRLSRILWGDNLVDPVINSFDWTTDWRVSPDNIRLTRELAEKWKSEGSADAAADRFEKAAEMEKALSKGEPLVRMAKPATSKGLPAGATSPFRGKIFFLTDEGCGSACLDFADIVLRMPGVTHIGRPTYGDAVYIDLLEKPLSSRLAVLSWPIKVYRNRVRSNNQFYTPKIRWPSGPMTDEAVVAWIKTLPPT